MNVIIVGGGKVGFYLARTLNNDRNKVTIIERDHQRAVELAARLSGPIVLEGNGTNPRTLQEAGVNGRTVVAAVTGRDEANYVACELARRVFHVHRTIARVNNPKNEEIFSSLGVDLTVSSTSIISRLVEQEVSANAVRTLITLEHGELDLVQVELSSTSHVAGKRVQDIAAKLPKDCVLVSVVRGHQVVVPRGDTVLRAYDTVFALCNVDSVDAFRKVIA